MVRIFVAILSAIFLVPFSTGGFCPAADGARARSVAVVVQVDGSPWFERMRQAVDAYSIASRSEQADWWRGDGGGDDIFLVAPAAATQEEQNVLLEELIAGGVDAICVVPVSPEACDPVLARARAAGIRIVVLGAPTTHCDIGLEPFEGVGREFSVDAVIDRYLDWESAHRSRFEADPSAGGSGTKLYDPAAAGAAMIGLALMLLDGQPVVDGLDLAVDGYHNLRIRPDDPRRAVGDAWLFVDVNRAGEFSF